MFFIPAGIKKQGVAEQAAIKQARVTLPRLEPGDEADKIPARR